MVAPLPCRTYNKDPVKARCNMLVEEFKRNRAPRRKAAPTSFKEIAGEDGEFGEEEAVLHAEVCAVGEGGGWT
jgi:hypothetical protein